MFEQDYLTRQIQQMIRALLKVLFRLEEETREKDQIEKWEPVRGTRLLKMVDEGKLNEAENLLYEELDTKNPEDLKLALGFYEYLNELDEDTLEALDFSREEIQLGIETVLKKFGYGGLTGLFEI